MSQTHLNVNPMAVLIVTLSKGLLSISEEIPKGSAVIVRSVVVGMAVEVTEVPRNVRLFNRRRVQNIVHLIHHVHVHVMEEGL